MTDKKPLVSNEEIDAMWGDSIRQQTWPCLPVFARRLLRLQAERLAARIVNIEWYREANGRLNVCVEEAARIIRESVE